MEEIWRSLVHSCMGVYKFSSRTGSTFSNFFACNLLVWGVLFASSEHAYQYWKAVCHHKWGIAQKILSSKDPRVAFRLGRRIRTGKNWQEEKVGVMTHVLWHKLYQCEPFRAELLGVPGTAVFVEDTSNWFWGRGSDNNGLNTLGVLLHVVKCECELMFA